MGIVNVLDKHTANLIAAGEVVERPSSAIKELMENSADAGSTKITVEIKNGGITYIRVSDNGCGMAADDVPVCILRHATSKIRTKDDLLAISTLGFRGEALAAIASVTRLHIMTKRKEDAIGTSFYCDFGEKKEIIESGCPDGTTIIAENLFENVPARRKFLRKDATETKAVCAVVEKFALSKPNIAVTLITDGSIKIKTPGDGNLKSCIYACLGREFSDYMLPVSYSYSGIEVEGFIGKPQIARPNRNLQNFFINGRYIKSSTMIAALEEGFTSFCPVGKFPACVLFVKIDFSLVDVNIHPSKLEVKFSNERPVFEAIMYAVKNTLSRGVSPFASNLANDDGYFESNKSFRGESSNSSSVFEDALKKRAEVIRSTGTLSVPNPQSIELIYGKQENTAVPSEQKKDNIFNEKAPGIPVYKLPDLSTEEDYEDAEELSEGSNENLSPEEKAAKEAFWKSLYDELTSEGENADIHQSTPRGNTENELSGELQARVKQGITVIGEAFNSYIIVERDGVLYIIDKHAAHERIIYESLKNAKKESGSQLLLMPLTVTLSSEEAMAISENGEYLENIGFVFKEAESGQYIIDGIPSEIDISDASEIFVYLAGQIASAGGRAIGDIFDRALYTAACKAAVKAGTYTSKLSSTIIADTLFSNEAVLYCPHGRPVIIEFTKEKLDKLFSRT